VHFKSNWRLYPIDNFAKHKDAWQDVNLRGSGTIALDSDFVEPLINEFSKGDEVLAVCGSPDRPRAMAIVAPKTLYVWETFQPSQAPLGMYVAENGLSIHSILPDLVCSLPSFAILLGLTQQDPELLSRPKDSGKLRCRDYIRTAKICVEGSFDEYWAGRGRNLRHNLKRQRNRLEREGIITRLEVVDRPEGIEQAIQDYGSLESIGWKGVRGTAVCLRNPQGRYYAEMLRRLSQRGKGRIYRYCYNDKPVAMDLCVHGGGVLIILKTAYDESQTTSSPALLMREESFKHIFTEGKIKQIEFYGRVMDWHQKWTAAVKTMYHVNCYRWPFLSTLHQWLVSRDAHH
jgi:hypothetical protein